jgi:ABC-type transport system involved in multi-copper enzyme maturation permease subunit
MRHVVRSEWTKLRRPGMLIGGLSSMILVAILGTVLGVATAGDRSSSGPRPGDAISMAQLHSAHGLAAALGQSTTMLGVVALCLCAAALAGEFSTGTIRNLLVREPRRLRLLAGMTVGVLLFLAAITLIALAVASGVAVAIASGKGVDVSVWFSGAGMSAAGRTLGNLLLATLGFGLIGATLGVLLRSPVAAIGVGVAYALPVEAILSETVSGIDRFLPGQLLQVVADGGSHSPTYAAAALTLLLYGTVAVVAVGALFSRRDVTS